jgi:2-polyprenyl-3-methyl-5-hydroxy-6-metoxy-1,4-benzoquinol methylase
LSDYWIELARKNSSFGQMQVLQTLDGERRYYLNDFLTQNTYDPNEKKSISLFTYMLKGLAEIYTTKIERALCIGMGVGIVPMALARDGVQVDVVEINPGILPLAAQYFNFERDKVAVTIGDGRYFLNQTPHQYDAIILDAFLGDSSPSHLITHQAFTSMKKVLKPEGVLVMNSFSDFKSGKDFFCGSLHKTMSSVFKSVVIHDGDNGNVFFVASGKDNFQRLREPNLRDVHAHCYEEVRSTYDRFKKPDASAGIILTDDFNPVDFFDAKNRETLRSALAWGMHGK